MAHAGRFSRDSSSVPHQPVSPSLIRSASPPALARHAQLPSPLLLGPRPSSPSPSPAPSPILLPLPPPLWLPRLFARLPQSSGPPRWKDGGSSGRGGGIEHYGGGTVVGGRGNWGMRRGGSTRQPTAAHRGASTDDDYFRHTCTHPQVFDRGDHEPSPDGSLISTGHHPEGYARYFPVRMIGAARGQPGGRRWVVNVGVPRKRRLTSNFLANNDRRGHGLVPSATTTTAGRPRWSRAHTAGEAGGSASPARRRRRPWAPRPPPCCEAQPPPLENRLAPGAGGGAARARPRRRSCLRAARAARTCGRRRGRPTVDPSSHTVRRGTPHVQLARGRPPVPLALVATTCGRRSGGGRAARAAAPLLVSPPHRFGNHRRSGGMGGHGRSAAAGHRRRRVGLCAARVRGERQVAAATRRRGWAAAASTAAGRARRADRLCRDGPCRHRRSRMAHVRARLPRTPTPRRAQPDTIDGVRARRRDGAARVATSGYLRDLCTRKSAPVTKL